MEYLQLKTVKLLLKNGANLNSKNAKGLTPLMLVIHKLSVINTPDELVIANILKLYNLTKRTDLSIHQNCTALYFDLQFNYCLDTVTMYMEKGVDILANINGTNILDICLKKFNLNDIICILSVEKHHQLSQLKFIDGTLLLNFLQSMKKRKEFLAYIMHKIKNVNTFVPFDSPIFAGYNLLHLTVIFDGFINIALSCNVDFRMLNADGVSPLHLAFRLKKASSVQIILNIHQKMPVNCVDRDNLSHLHIACVMQNYKLIELLLRNGVDPNLQTQCDFQWNFNEQSLSHFDKIKKGSTPLHIAVNMMEYDLAIVLLSHGANSYVPDADGITPFQIILNRYDSSSYDKKLWKLLQTHLASVLDKMLENDMKALMVTDACLKTFYDALTCNNQSWNCKLQKMVHNLYQEKQYKKLGLTKLQLACVIGDISVMEEELKLGAKVNECINIESLIWPGNTALHILSVKNCWSQKIVEMLIVHDADPTVKNADNLTPIHLVEDGFAEDAILLLSNKFTSVNPINDEGLSHFHLACKEHNLPLIQEFLKSGVDVNVPVDYFADRYAGYTPLHFAIECSVREIIELLVRHGANPNVIEGTGLTPLDFAAYHQLFVDGLGVLLRCPATDVRFINVKGESAFESFLESILFIDEDEFEDMVNLFLYRGAYSNFAKFTAKQTRSSNLLALATSNLSKSTFRRLVAAIPDVTKTDDKGQNAIHYLVALKNSECTSKSKFISNVGILIQRGCEINHQDIRGKTALHKAVSLKKFLVVDALLKQGGDVNMRDDTGLRIHFFDFPTKQRIKFINYIERLRKLRFYGDETSESSFSDDSDEDFIFDTIDKINFQLMLEEKLGTPFSVNYFFMERFIVDYRRMPTSQRQVIRDVCESSNLQQKFPALYPFIRLQFRKARARTRLLEPATAAFQTLFNIILPEPCLESVFMYLDNSEIMNMIRSVNIKLKFGCLPINC